jgi:hypothetical protein
MIMTRASTRMLVRRQRYPHSGVSSKRSFWRPVQDVIDFVDFRINSEHKTRRLLEAGENIPLFPSNLFHNWKVHKFGESECYAG